MQEIEKIKKDINKIIARNKRVEKDKAWETSLTRRVAIAAITYVLISIFLVIVKVEKPFIASIIPAIAFLISTVTLGYLKNWWLRKNE